MLNEKYLNNGFEYNCTLNLERPYGRYWQKLRLRVFLRDSYQCQICNRVCVGRHRFDDRAPECDHIIPIHKLPPNRIYEIENLQTLCRSCHKQKSVEDFSKGASTHPLWLPEPKCKVILVTGAPGAGKSRWATKNMLEQDVLIDLDLCFEEICGFHGHDLEGDQFHKYFVAAMRLRNAQLAALQNQKEGRAFFITSAPTEKEVDWWCNILKADHHRVAVSYNQVKKRKLSRSRLLAAQKWFEAEKQNRWNAPKQKGSDISGAPLDPNHPWNV